MSRQAQGEDDLVAWLAERLAPDPARVPIGIGDDAAAVRLDGKTVIVTSDMLLDTVHFQTREHDYPLIGRKAIACSLSDCAAMACRPRAATVSIALPRTITLDQVEQLYEGMASVADEFGCAIVGGDTTRWSAPLAIDVAMLAEPMADRGPIRRSDARPGDTLYVSGPLGGSIIGKHLTFTPRIELAARLGRESGLHAMMDVSDGLALDVHRLSRASSCDVELSVAELEHVVSEDARTCAATDGRSPLDHALSDGEDFELLVAARDDLPGAAYGLIPVGRVVARTAPDRSTVTLVYPDGRLEPVAPRGFDHFQ